MNNPFMRADAGGSFLPTDYVKQRGEARANILCLSLFGAVMFTVVAAFFVTNRQWLTVRAEQRMINVEYTAEAQKIEQLKLLEGQKSQMLEKAEITTALLERVPRSVLLAELIMRMPRQVTLLDLSLEGKRISEPVQAASTKAGTLTKGGASRGSAQPTPTAEPAVRVTVPKIQQTLRIQGVAKQNEDIADYYASLKQCLLLEDVELTYIKARKINDADLREFEFTATIRPDADARSIEPVEKPIQGSQPAMPTGVSSATEGGGGD